VKVQQEQGLRNILLVDAQDIGNSFLARKFCHLITVYQLKKYEYPQLAPTVSEWLSYTFSWYVDVQVLIHWSVLQVVKDERLQQAIEAAAQHDYSKIGEKDDELYKSILQGHETRAIKILYDMRSTLSDFLLRYSNPFSL
jgi:hypothetical protein